MNEKNSDNIYIKTLNSAYYGEIKMKQTWHLENVQEIAKEAPYTFYVPSNELINRLQVGHLVKLMFANDTRRETDQSNAERMWVEITKIDGEHYVGVLDNIPYEIQHLKAGDEIHFQAYHIMSVYNVIDPIPSLAKDYWDKCWTTFDILDGKASIAYLIRDEPIDEQDSGWQILSGDESDEYLNEDNCACVALGTVLNLDDSFRALLTADIGSSFVKNEQGEWVKALEDK